MAKHLIINADDFGASSGINRGVIECHTRGVVTSTSLMVSAPAADEAAAFAAAQPELSVGLHADLDEFVSADPADPASVRTELERQSQAYTALMGAPPTHLDSHHHVHMEAPLASIFREAADSLGVPLRGGGQLALVGGFYAQWKWRVTELRYVSVGFLQQLLRDEVGDVWTELTCHPGYVEPSYESVYSREREAELRTLTDPRIPATLDDLGIRLESFHAYARRTEG